MILHSNIDLMIKQVNPDGSAVLTWVETQFGVADANSTENYRLNGNGNAVGLE